RPDDAVAFDVVGHVEEPPDEGLVAFDDLGADRVTVAFRELLADESAFRAVRHDDRVLDLLGLHQAEYLGPEVLAAVRPANAAARAAHRAQMHALDSLRVDEALEHRPRRRELGELRWVELERQIPLRLAAGVLKEVRAQGRLDRGRESAQD